MSEVIKHLEAQIADSHVRIKQRDAAIRLFDQPDFKSLVLEYFGKDECVRYLTASTDPGLTPAQRADALALAQAPGLLRRFLPHEDEGWRVLRAPEQEQRIRELLDGQPVEAWPEAVRPALRTQPRYCLAGRKRKSRRAEGENRRKQECRG